MSIAEQFLDKMRPNESGAARDENFHRATVRRKREPGKMRTWSELELWSNGGLRQ
jgi:hypothetical protein